MTAPGWYPDVHDRSVERWWDGAQWATAVRPAPSAARGRNGLPTAWIVAGVVGALAAVLIFVLVLTRPWKSDVSRTPIFDPSAPFLRHRSVERYIEAQFGVSGVLCANGLNIVIREGDLFDCETGDGQRFTVTLLDNNGKYEVSED